MVTHSQTLLHPKYIKPLYAGKNKLVNPLELTGYLKPHSSIQNSLSSTTSEVFSHKQPPLRSHHSISLWFRSGLIRPFQNTKKNVFSSNNLEFIVLSMIASCPGPEAVKQLQTTTPHPWCFTVRMRL